MRLCTSKRDPKPSHKIAKHLNGLATRPNADVQPPNTGKHPHYSIDKNPTLKQTYYRCSNVVFWEVGLANCRVSTHIQRAPEVVFEKATDVAQWPQLIRGIKATELLTEGAIGKGTRFTETRVMFGKDAVETMEFTEFEAPNRYTVEATSHGCHYRSVITFSERDGGTLMEMDFQARPVTFFAKIMGFMTRFMMKGMTKMMQADLDDLKQGIEAESTA